MNWKEYSWIIGMLFILYGLIGVISPQCQALLSGVAGPHYWQCQWFIFKFQILSEFVNVLGLSFIISIIVGFIFLIFWYKKFKKKK
jgi:hypothetical protein